MSIKELDDKLGEMYHNAPTDDAVTMIHLFGIKYADQIAKSTYSKKDIAEAAGIQPSYVTEISKGVKLAKYVTPKH